METVNIPVDPPLGLLISMALRYDHSLGDRSYYTHNIQPFSKITWERKMNDTINLMRQVYEEVSGNGFYKPELEEKYTSILKDNE